MRQHLINTFLPVKWSSLFKICKILYPRHFKTNLKSQVFIKKKKNLKSQVITEFD